MIVCQVFAPSYKDANHQLWHVFNNILFVLLIKW